MSSQDRNARSGIAAASFCAISLAFIGLEKWKQRAARRKQRVSIDDQMIISDRGDSMLLQIFSYMPDLMRSWQDPYHPYTNPKGHITLCVAENKLCIELLGSRLMQYESSTRAFSDTAVYCYGNTLGLPGPREAVAYFLAKHFMHPERRDMGYTEALDHVRSEDVAFGAGAGTLVSHLALSLTDAGDAVLIPAPYYAAFTFDLTILAKCTVIPVYSSNPSMGPTPDELENAALSAEERGLRVRVLLLTNPNNPLGTIYPPGIILSSIVWARNRSMHTIVDEIYALSAQESDFESVLKILHGDLRNDVHHLYALSKDFCASGFRIGFLYTKNKRLLSCVANLNTFANVSQPMQIIVQDLLTDDNFIYGFLEQSRQRTRYNYELCVSHLVQMVIPYIEAKAGIFVYADFSSLLPEQTAEGEARFSSLLVKAGKIIMTPGQAQLDRKPGMFRICYAYVSPEVLAIALQRLDKIVGKIRRCRDWDNLNAESLIDIL